jgi:hypothetical protein
MEAVRALRDDAREWATGRWWQWRLPILLLMARETYVLMTNEDAGGFFGGITFGIHELGHVIFAWAGHFLMSAGGSLMQVAAPIAAGLLLARQRDWFGVAVATTWLGSSLWNLARYVADARAQELPLLGLSDEPEHDWAYLLETLGMLELDTALAGLVRLVAIAAWLAALGFGGWLCWVMFETRKSGR